MKRVSLPLFAIALLLSAAACQDRQPEASSLATAQRAIVGGTTTTGWPAVGALTTSLPFYGYQGAFCTATLIEPQWVLTAGHCLYGSPENPTEPATTFFMVGSDARPSGTVNGPTDGTLYASDAFYIHPQYDPNVLDNDIAILHLAQPVTGVTPRQVNAAYLNAVGESAHYVGFGATEGVGSTGGGLKRETSVDIGWIYDTQFNSDFSGTGTCFGDSGGPAFLTINGVERVIGVNSAGIDCNPNVNPSCDPDPCHRLSIATRVDPYASWISSVTNSTPPTCQATPGMCACAAACQASGQCDNAACQVQDCEATYDCLVACGDDGGCQSGCYSGATATAQAQLSALFDCIGSYCDSLSGDAYSQCVSQQCGAQVSACFPMGTGAWSCREVYGCLVECPDGDSQCLSDCYEQGTGEAQAQYDAMQQCFSDECGSAADFQACATAQCGAEIDTCLPTLTGDAACDEVADCISQCSSGDNDCAYGCFETGTSSAQDAYIAVVDCIDLHCSSQSGDAYQSCVSASCGVEMDTCFPPANCPLTGGGCPAGQACYPTASGATDCFSSNGKAVGAACSSSIDTLDCGDGAICADDVCELWCATDVICGPGVSCEKPLIADFPNYGVCGCEDADQDGTCASEDCDDADVGVHPGAAEACGDGVDNDCDGQTDEECAACVDADSDGYCAGVDCDESDASVNPAATEKCGDSRDNDCDGQTDEGCSSCVDADGDGYCADVDCLDGDADSHPGAEEVCGDGKDNNCSGAADEGCSDDPNNPDTTFNGYVPRKSSGCGGGGAGWGWLALAALLVAALPRRRRREA